MSVSPEYDMLIVICVQQEIVKSYQNRALIFYHLNCYNSISIYGFLWAISATLVYQRVVEGLFFLLYKSPSVDSYNILFVCYR